MLSPSSSVVTVMAGGAGGSGWPRGAYRRRCRRHVVELEAGRHLRQARRLVLHAFGRRRRFFHQGRILLRYLVHLRDGLVDLVDAHALLGAGGGDLGHDVGDVAHAVDHFAHGAASLLYQPRAVVDLFHRVADQGLDFARRCRRTPPICRRSSSSTTIS